MFRISGTICRVVKHGVREYQEYYLDSVSDLAVVRKRGSEIEEMWRLEIEK